uniref:Uncharacterized protein n=1 Tax=Lepeophtheirus salmonis TaxID=72036 RepID=A0A0K2T710_LEPSM
MREETFKESSIGVRCASQLLCNRLHFGSVLSSDNEMEGVEFIIHSSVVSHFGNSA